jgi:hypothetical protein
MLPKITPAELKEFADNMSPHSSCVVKTVEHRKCTTETRLLDVLTTVSEMEVCGVF